MVMIDSIAEGAGPPPDLKRTRRQKPSAADPTKVDRLPPHDCMGECVEKFKSGAEVFYDLRHQTIYSALAEMYDSREAIDVITLQQRLKNKQLLEEVGGIPYLASLPDTVPSSANLTYYLEIVQ